MCGSDSTDLYICIYLCKDVYAYNSLLDASTKMPPMKIKFDKIKCKVIFNFLHDPYSKKYASTYIFNENQNT